jgi:aminoglycoside/choline kinase family phosphotransferase
MVPNCLMNLKKDDGYMKEFIIRTAFILGAGLGTRLRPLTSDCPKPLLPVGGRPLITFAMDHCLTVGVERFIVNTHHCAEAYDRAFPERSWRGWPILFRHEPVLLDTAGGLKNIEDLLTDDERLLVCNGDILSDLPLHGLLSEHKAGGREVTLVLRSDGPLGNVCLDVKGEICDFRDILGNPGVRRCLFTGIYAVEKRFLRRLTPGKVESVVPVFVEMIREAPGSVASVVIDEGQWEEIGDTEAYARIVASFPLKAELLGVARGRSDPDEWGMDGRGREAEAFVRHTLGLPEDAPIALVPVGRGGSDRDFFHIDSPGGGSAILMHYGRLREENNYYAGIAGFLRQIGVAVPTLLGHDSERGLLLMEDLGNENLFDLRDTPWEIRCDLYEKTLALAAKLHAFSLDRFPTGLRLMPGFDANLYRWERDYFREYCVQNVCRIDLADWDDEALEAELSALAERLLSTPPALIHRDLQSQNVIIRRGEPVLIDFQGMRLGIPFYDLGSLLCDPYVGIREADRTALLGYYYDLSRSSYGRDEFRELFLLASAQRLMQALGAYGFLGLKRGKPHFLAHIHPALENLVAVTAEAGRLPCLYALACRCRTALGT